MTIKVLSLVLLMILGVPAGGRLVQAAQPPAQEGFVPVDQLQDQERLPAAPLIAAAYGVAWGAVLIYVWFLWRRLARVERELADVARRMEAGGRR